MSGETALKTREEVKRFRETLETRVIAKLEKERKKEEPKNPYLAKIIEYIPREKKQTVLEFSDELKKKLNPVRYDAAIGGQATVYVEAVLPADKKGLELIADYQDRMFDIKGEDSPFSTNSFRKAA